jgi:hypothetical protein
MTLCVRPALFLLALPVAACGGTSDGDEGDSGRVRFSLVSNYSDTSDLSAPIASNRPIFVALQHPKEGLLDDETFVKLTLDVQGPDGKRVESVWPLGFAQYGVLFEEKGSYRLLAKDQGAHLDGITVNVADLETIELSKRVFVTTNYQAAGRSCSKLEEVQGIENVTLHKNQRVEVAVVPKSGEGTPMLGLLALTARASDSVMLDAQILGQGRLANSFIVKPNGTLPERIAIEITEEDSGKPLAVSLAANDTDQVLDCSE